MITSNGTKRCSCCKQEKGIEAFSKDSSRVDGLDYNCKDCRSARESGRQRPSQQSYQKQYWAKNRASLIAKQRERYANRTVEQIEKKREGERKRKARNRDLVRKQQKTYRLANSQSLVSKAYAYWSRKPEVRKAAIALKDAIRAGRIKPARECLCADCGKQAQHYHHESYAPAHWLDVVPLCASCHQKRHAKAPISFVV